MRHLAHAFLALSLLLASACHSARVAPPATPAPSVAAEKPYGPLLTFAGPRATETERAECKAKGGLINVGGLLGRERCTRQFTDAGKTCADSAECQGQCRAEASGPPGAALTGTCSATDSPYGCYTIVTEGRSAGVLCVD